MGARDLKTRLSAAVGIEPAAQKTANVTGATIDLLGYDGATCLLNIGVITDGTFTAKLQDSTDSFSADTTDVGTANLVGAFTAADSDSDQAIQIVGYTGVKRYVRVYVTVTGSPSTGGFIASSWIRGYKRQGSP